jgi:hypothetical protein
LKKAQEEEKLEALDEAGVSQKFSVAPRLTTKETTKPIWYSELSRQIDKLPQKEMTAAQWKALLINPEETKSRGVRGPDNKVIPGEFITSKIPATSKLPGVKMKEIDDTEILEWLDVAGESFEVDDYIDVLNKKYGVRKEGRITYPGWEDSDLTADELRTLKNEQSGGRKNTKISKDEVQKFLADGGAKIEFQDEVLGAQTKEPAREGAEEDLNEVLFKIDDLVNRREEGSISEKEYKQKYSELSEIRDELQLEIEAEENQAETQFSNYQLPGGENYREAFVTVPNSPVKIITQVRRLTPEEIARNSSLKGKENKSWWGVVGDDGKLVNAALDTQDKATELLRELKSTDGEERFSGKIGGKSDWKDGHASYSGIDNPVVRIRFNDRTDVDGNKVLFLEELQPPNNPEFGKMPKTLQDRWLAIGLKRMIRYAADNGYDKVAWTTGEQQVQRYESALRKQVDAIEWEKTPEGVHIKGYKNDTYPAGSRFSVRDVSDAYDETPWGVFSRGEIVETFVTRQEAQAYAESNDQRTGTSGLKVADTRVAENDLTEVLGKVMADRIRKDPAQTGTIEGENLTVDSPGVKKLYDVGIPSLANKILKELGGGKVGETQLETGKKTDRLAVVRRNDGQFAILNLDANVNGEGEYTGMFKTRAEAEKAMMESGKSQQQSFDITPALRERAMQGMSRFSVAPRIAKNIVQNDDGQFVYTGQIPSTLRSYLENSVFKDKDGNPILMFHGTAQDISEFRAKQAGAIFIAPNPDIAVNYSQESAQWMADHADEIVSPKQIAEALKKAKTLLRENGYNTSQIAKLSQNGILKTDEFREAISVYMPSGPNVMPMFVRAEKPFDYENADQLNEVIKQAKEFGGDFTKDQFSRTNNWTTIEEPTIQRAIKALGYDSFYVAENNSKNLAVYDSSQVKSVTGNTGEFNPESKDIRRSVAPRLSSDIDHKREKSTGRYVGAPDWVGNSTRNLNFLGRTLDNLAYEGRNGRYWYEKSSKAILDMVDGNKIDAEKFVGLVALFSAGNQVNSNMGMAIRAWYEWKGTGHITAGRFPATQGPKAERWLNKGEDYSGIKVNNFYLDLMEEIDPAKVDKEHSTMDMWMALAGDYGSKILDQGPKYNFMQREIKRIADNLGWKPHQAQAAIWTAIKARVESSETERKAFELKKGIAHFVNKIDPETGKIKNVFDIVDGKEYAHFRTATKFGLALEITQNQIDELYYDFSNAIRERTVQLSTEATPGVTSGVLPGIHAAPNFQKIEYLEAIRKIFTLPNGKNRLFEKLGMLARTGGVQFSGWQGVTTVGQQNKIAVRVTGGNVEPSSELLLNLAGSIYGLATNQEGVAWHYPTFQLPTTPVFGLNGIEIDVGRNLTEKQTDDLYKNLIKELGHSYSPPIPTDTGFRVINFPKEKAAYDAAKEVEKSGQLDVFNKGIIANYRSDLSKANNKFVESVIRALDKFPYLAKSVKRFSSYGNLIENDWSDGDNDYRIQIARAVQELSDNGSQIGRSDLQKWINGVLLPEVASVNKNFAQKYGWGAAEPNQKPFRGEDFGKLSVAPRLGDRPERGRTGKERQICASQNGSISQISSWARQEDCRSRRKIC